MALGSLTPGARVQAQVSPGPLARAHADLDGTFGCAQCHAFGTGRVAFKCLDCHRELRTRLQTGRGYHARIVRGGANSSDCARCHSEHNGRNYPIVRWRTPRQRFDHREAGWPVEGRHRGLRCEECHQPKYIAASERATLKRTDLSKSFLGLSPLCSSCHMDPHKGELGQDCARCHTLDTWKEPPGFTHQKTEFPLTGKHAAVECARCHSRPSGVGVRTVYRNFTFHEYCKSCHQDPHGGAFPADCGKCHTTDGWRSERLTRSFDHSNTDYPLAGKHAAVACRKCHAAGNFGVPVAHQRCLDCHNDYHEGQFRSRRDGGDCGACHAVAGYLPARFGIAEHAETGYPLNGKHAAVECARCHRPAKGATPYHPPHGACQDCHADAHANQFAAAPRHNRCEPCHAVDGFRPAQFTLADHRQTRFTLAGAHAAVACSACHHSPDGRPESKRFHFASLECGACHRNPHAPDGGPPAALPSCDRCHTLRTWKETGPFDHAATAFPLLGRHRTTACSQCHKPSGDGPTRQIAFAGAARHCAGCHEDPHGGQFLMADCARCHTALTWQPAEFDHARHSRFPLNGAHDRVPCRLCHQNRRTAGGRTLILYRGTPHTCEGCHS